MIYNIVSPFSLSINAESYKEAVKNFIKINHTLNINRLIIKNKNEYMKAKIDYYTKLGRNKFGVKLMPYNNVHVYPTSNVISPLSLTSPIPTSTLPLIPSPTLPTLPTYISPTYTSPTLPTSPITSMMNDNSYLFPTKVSKKELKQKLFNLSLLTKIK